MIRLLGLIQKGPPLRGEFRRAWVPGPGARGKLFCDAPCRGKVRRARGFFSTMAQPFCCQEEGMTLPA